MSNGVAGLRARAAELRGNHKTLAERAFATLHGAIIAGALPPGQRLPIDDLAEALEMSPMPIREALRGLDAVGLVENIPHRGARVAELSIHDLHEVYEARLALEPLAIRLAAENFSEADATNAREKLETLEQAYSGGESDDQIWEAHTAFHFALYGPADSRWLERLIKPLWESSERYRRATPATRSLRERRSEHRKMLATCVAGEPEAAAMTLHNHLALTANLLAEEMGGEQLFAILKDATELASTVQTD
jgi:DNA-binding GntR family transcriptional regulator